MHFLPFFTLFLFVFAAISASFVSSELSDSSESLSYQGRLRALRLAHSEYERKLYERGFRRLNEYSEANDEPKNKKVNRPNNGKENKPKSTLEGQNQKTEEELIECDQDKQHKDFRMARIGSFYGAIYLEKCVQNDVDGAWLKGVATSYLKAVYGNARFIRAMKNPHWAEELLSFIIAREKEAYKKYRRYLPLDQFCPEGKLGEHYFRLMRGTNNFDPLLGSGFLPLERCITFQGRSRGAINIHYANPQLLMTLFGSEGYEQIYRAEHALASIAQKDKEQKDHPEEGRASKDYSLNRDELKNLLGDRLEPIHDRNIDYTFRLYSQLERVYDPQTSISAEIFETSEHKIKHDRKER